MPATTRSRTKQLHLEDFPSEAPEGKSKQKSEDGHVEYPLKPARRKQDTGDDQKSRPSIQTKNGSKHRKRKQPAGEAQSLPTAKREKQEHLTSEPTRPTFPPILINRAPVLHLWSACVARFLHPEIPWQTCLGVGSAISTLCAISKGRSIGTIEPPDRGKKAERDAKKRQAQTQSTGEVELMGFRLLLKGDQVLVLGKVRTGNEAPLRAKFGEAYDRVKGVMEDALGTWKGRSGELDKKAFSMYEQIRPTVQSGQGGWGKKGELRLQKITEVVERK